MKMSFVMVREFDVTNDFPPLGILTIAALLDSLGHETTVHDVIEGEEEFIEEIAQFQPDIIGFSMQTPQYAITEKCCEKIKADPRFKDTRFCVGGIHVTAMPEETLRAFGGGVLDFIVCGEGELTCQELLDNGGEYKGISGIAYIDDQDHFHHNQRTRYVEDLSSLPVVNRDKIDFKRYLKPPGMIRGKMLNKVTPFMTSRGCPWNCTFCCGGLMFSRKVRRRSVEHCIQEFRELIDKWDIDGVMFIDDIFTLDREWLVAFLDEFVKLPKKLVWGCESRVDTLDEETLRLLIRYGCSQVEFGVESGSDQILKIINKKITQRQILDTFALTRSHGMRTGASFQVGHPYETVEDVKETYKVIKAIQSDYTVIFYSTPFPGSAFYDLALKENWFVKDDSFDSKWTIRQAEYPIVEAGLSLEEAKFWRNKIQNSVWIRNYVRWSNVRFAAKLGYLFLIRPHKLVHAIIKMMRNRRLDDLIESGLNMFQEYDSQRKT